MLLENGADRGIKYNGLNALEWAKSLNNKEIVKIFEKHGKEKKIWVPKVQFKQ